MNQVVKCISKMLQIWLEDVSIMVQRCFKQCFKHVSNRFQVYFKHVLKITLVSGTFQKKCFEDVPILFQYYASNSTTVFQKCIRDTSNMFPKCDSRMFPRCFNDVSKILRFSQACSKSGTGSPNLTVGARSKACMRSKWHFPILLSWVGSSLILCISNGIQLLGIRFRS